MYKLRVIAHSSVEPKDMTDIKKICQCIYIQSPQDLLVQIGFSSVDEDHEILHGIISGIETVQGILFSDLGTEMRVTNEGYVQVVFKDLEKKLHSIKIFAVPFESC